MKIDLYLIISKFIKIERDFIKERRIQKRLKRIIPKLPRIKCKFIHNINQIYVLLDVKVQRLRMKKS
jgi:hypothetical protein